MTNTNRVKKVIADCLGAKEVKINDHIVDDLGADSLDTIEVVMAIEEEFGIIVLDEEERKIKTVRDYIDLVGA